MRSSVLPLLVLSACGGLGVAAQRSSSETPAVDDRSLPERETARAPSAARSVAVRETTESPNDALGSAPQPEPDPPAWTANSVMEQLWEIERTLLSSRYTPIPRVDPGRGRYDFDCSALVAWTLSRTRPVAFQGLRFNLDHRPLARDFHQFVARVPRGTRRHAWHHLAHLEDALPGDLIAWLRPPHRRSPLTGHVAFVALRPKLVQGRKHAYLVRVIDATRWVHADDSRAATQATGFGQGTILLETDETGYPRRYGWRGLESRRLVATDIVIGRPMR